MKRARPARPANGMKYQCLCEQAARDALAALHGEPQQHKQVEPALAAAAADSLHTHSQRTVLDSLVGLMLGSGQHIIGKPLCCSCPHELLIAIYQL